MSFGDLDNLPHWWWESRLGQPQLYEKQERYLQQWPGCLSLGLHGMRRYGQTPHANDGNKSGSLSFELIRYEPDDEHSVVIRTMETPSSHCLKQFFGFGGDNLCCTLSV